MENYENPQSFRSKPVEIGIGAFDEHGVQQKIKISDITYGNHSEFIRLLNNIWMRFQTLPKTVAIFDEIVKNLVNRGMAVSEAINKICEDISSIYKTITEDEKLTLLKLLTNNQVNEGNIKTMQVTEVYGLLVWLIERNLRAEKNFEASLSSILTKKQEDMQK